MLNVVVKDDTALCDDQVNIGEGHTHTPPLVGGGEEPVVWKAASDVTSQGEGLSSPKGGHALYMAPELGGFGNQSLLHRDCKA